MQKVLFTDIFNIGDYVIISPIKEGNKVQGEIVYILYNKQIKYLKDESLW